MRRRFWIKKYAWAIAIGGAKILKRGLDILVALVMMFLLAPLVAFVAAAIKLTDRGPVLFWQVRVGRWGREFPFPKFRSMVMNAERLKDTLLI
jgi:lipopolysaccharide/colanic/teichoic acid biosynthesis glycosyltransferase